MGRGFPVLLAAVLAAGTGALAWGTEGFRVVTSDGARRLAIERTPRPVPDITLIDQNGARFSFGSYRGKPLLVEFIYTNCPTICGVLGDNFRRMLTPRGPNLLSISFDPAHDGPRALSTYGARHGASAPRWRVAVPAEPAGLRALLATFGVVVIPDSFGGFTHNAAVYVVDARGRLVRILDADASPALIEQTVRAVS